MKVSNSNQDATPSTSPNYFLNSWKRNVVVKHFSEIEG
jgi:hypothetical protein